MTGSDAAAPLLEKKAVVYHEGCPGCGVDRRKALNLGIPYKEFFHIWIIILVSSMFANIIVIPLLVFHGASYMLGRALTSTAWGMVADRIGRKPVIVFGIFSTFLFNLLFGLSVHYWMAISTRFLLGSLNGLLGPIRAYAIEVCRPEHQAIGLSLVSTAWAVGLIVGPTIGGYLAQPTEKYPKLFPVDSLFGRFPYFLPCLCISGFCFVVLISCIWLPETLQNHKTSKMKDQASEPLITHFSDPEEVIENNITSTNKMNLLKNWPLMSSIILFCIVCFDDMAYTEIFSLWAESDKKYGGLSFTTEDVGQVLAISGVSLILYQTFIYPRIVRVLGPVNTSRVAVSISMVALFTYAPITHLSRPWSSIAVSIVTCCFILQNNSVTQDQRATANGLATTLMSFCKAFAPAGAGIVFSWTQKRQHAFFFPGDQMLFFLLVIVEFVALVWTFKPFLAVPEQFS
ncbi:unnamed protein product [Alopecurus aequalis]